MRSGPGRGCRQRAEGPDDRTRRENLASRSPEQVGPPVTDQSAGSTSTECNVSSPDFVTRNNYLALRAALYNILECYLPFRVCYIGKTGMIYSICYITYAIYHV